MHNTYTRDYAIVINYDLKKLINSFTNETLIGTCIGTCSLQHHAIPLPYTQQQLNRSVG